MFLFGLRTEDVREWKNNGYNPLDIYSRNDAIRNVLNRFSMGMRDKESYSDLVSRLVYGGDEYMLLADFDSYVAAHESLYAKISDKRARSKMSLINIARSGIFAADRAVAEYARKIWNI